MTIRHFLVVNQEQGNAHTCTLPVGINTRGLTIDVESMESTQFNKTSFYLAVL